jgi:hypothetical protein
MASMFRRAVIAVLLAAWSFPAAAAGLGPETKGPAPIVESTGAPARSQSTGTVTVADEAQGYAAREQQTKNLNDFRGGEGYLYIGGGALTVALLVLLILILV